MWIDIIFHLDLLVMFGVVVLIVHAGLRQKPVPNSLFLFILFLYPIAVLSSPTAINWMVAFFSALPVLIIGYFLFVARIMAANDVKLITILCFWAGPAALSTFLAITLITGSFLAIVAFSIEGAKQAMEGTGFRRGFRFAVRANTQVQLGPAIVLGALSILLSYEQIINLSL